MANEDTMLTTKLSNGHAPSYNLIDLDYPLHGTTVVKCGGRKFDLEVVKKALALVAELGGELKHG